MMDQLEEIANDLLAESAVDFIAFPHIVSIARWRLGAKYDAEARSISLKIARKLYDHGLRPGDYYLGTRFDYWLDQGRQAMLTRIEREWIAAGADPNLAEPICWFAARPA